MIDDEFSERFMQAYIYTYTLVVLDIPAFFGK